MKVGDLVELYDRAKPAENRYIGIITRTYEKDIYSTNIADVMWTTHYGCRWGHQRMFQQHLLKVISEG